MVLFCVIIWFREVEMATDNLDFANKIREIASRYLIPEKGSKNDIPVMRSEGMYGVECLVSLSCIFRAIDTCQKAYVLQAFSDLMWGLGRNQFWKQYEGEILPIVRMAFNDYMTYGRLLADQHKTSEKDLIADRCKHSWLGIFPTAIGCMYGHPRMMECSHAILQELNQVL